MTEPDRQDQPQEASPTRDRHGLSISQEPPSAADKRRAQIEARKNKPGRPARTNTDPEANKRERAARAANRKIRRAAGAAKRKANREANARHAEYQRARRDADRRHYEAVHEWRGDRWEAQLTMRPAPPRPRRQDFPIIVPPPPPPALTAPEPEPNPATSAPVETDEPKPQRRLAFAWKADYKVEPEPEPRVDIPHRTLPTGPAPEPTPPAENRQVPPALGWKKANTGRVSYVHAGTVIQGTTVQLCGLFPFTQGSGSPTVGVPMGRHMLSGEDVAMHPIEWVNIGLTTNPGIMVLGSPGTGKTTAIKRLCTGLTAFNVEPLVLGDVKGEYTALFEALGGQVITAGRGRNRINPLDSGPLGRLAATLSGGAQEQVIAEIRGRRLVVLEGLCQLIRKKPLRDHEVVALSIAVDLLQETKTDDPIVPDVLRILEAGPIELRRAMYAGNLENRPARPIGRRGTGPHHGQHRTNRIHQHGQGPLLDAPTTVRGSPGAECSTDRPTSASTSTDRQASTCSQSSAKETSPSRHPSCAPGSGDSRWSMRQSSKRRATAASASSCSTSSGEHSGPLPAWSTTPTRSRDSTGRWVSPARWSHSTRRRHGSTLHRRGPGQGTGLR